VRIDILTIFPNVFTAPLAESLLGKAIEGHVVDVRVHDIRAFADAGDPHRSVDDASFGGGPGMVMRPEPIVAAAEAIGAGEGRTFVLSPAGRRLDQSLVRELAREARVTLVCGRYEGVDERVVEVLGAEELSIGDYVCSGGEFPALVVVDAVVRLLPGVLGNERSHERESFEDRLLDHPHYTRPRVYRGLAVPEVLVSGNHGEVERWRVRAARDKTRRNRPDLLDRPE
jgi:tRNA (guanine37-N1)-methyltransferase